MGRVAARGSFHLFIGLAVSNLIMAIGTIILTRIMLPEEYGLYSIALIPSFMFALFRDWGVGSAMTKYIAQYRSESKHSEVYAVVLYGVIFEATVSLFLSVLALSTVSFIATAIFQRPESSYLLAIASLTIVSGGILTTAQSVFLGFERMALNSITMILQSVVKVIIGPLLIFFGFGALGAVLGYTLAVLTAGIFGIIMLFFLLLRNVNKKKIDQSELKNGLRMMLKYGVPMSISTILSGFLVQFYGFMMAAFCSDLLIGNYHAATNFAVIVTFFVSPISQVLFPTFSKVDPQRERQLMRTIFELSVKYASLLIVPLTVAIIVFSGPMVHILFGEKWVYTPFFLSLYVVSNLFSVIGNLSLASFLGGTGETKILMKQGVITLLFGLPLGLLLVPPFGILGVIAGNLVAGIPGLLWCCRWAIKHYGIAIGIKSSLRILLASGIAGVVVLPITMYINVDWIKLFLGGLVFLFTYVLAVSLLGSVSRRDIGNLRTMFSGMGPVSKILDLPLILSESIIDINSRKNTKTKFDDQQKIAESF
jgi:O-antigen/teichoic acid export membrane protein